MQIIFINFCLFNTALRIHGIKGDNKLSVKFFDNYGAPVDEETFPLLVRQFHTCNGFYLEIEVTSDSINAFTRKVSFCNLFIFAVKKKWMSIRVW